MSLLKFHEDALPRSLFGALRRQVVALGSERIRSTYQTTFWFPLSEPSCLPEAAALRLRALVPADRRVIGVEWWLSRMRTSNVMVDFHVDRDEKLALRTGRIVSPLWSSVLFLNLCEGGLLAVTKRPPREENPAKAPAVIDFDLAAPRPNRFVVFKGSLTHGVLDADNAIPGRRIRREVPMRYTVIFNWWHERPTDVPMWSETSIYRSLAGRSGLFGAGRRPRL